MDLSWEYDTRTYMHSFSIISWHLLYKSSGIQSETVDLATAIFFPGVQIIIRLFAKSLSLRDTELMSLSFSLMKG